MLLGFAVAALSGFATPLVMQRLGRDPALGASVVLTTITDIAGFGIFLALGRLVFGVARRVFCRAFDGVYRRRFHARAEQRRRLDAGRTRRLPGGVAFCLGGRLSAFRLFACAASAAWARCFWRRRLRSIFCAMRRFCFCCFWRRRLLSRRPANLPQESPRPRDEGVSAASWAAFCFSSSIRKASLSR